jgi:hypothetical protein
VQFSTGLAPENQGDLDRFGQVKGILIRPEIRSCRPGAARQGDTRNRMQGIEPADVLLRGAASWN